MLTTEEAQAVAPILASSTKYIETFLKIRSISGKLIDFRLNPVQKAYLATKRETLRVGRPLRFLVLKARRQGFTTLEQASSFYVTANRPHQQVATIAHKKESTEVIFRMVNLFYEKLPEQIRPKRLTERNKGNLNLVDLNSFFYVGTAGSKGFGRGDTLNRFHGSEFAWWPFEREEQRKFLVGLLEAASHAEVVLETTANGVGNLFYEMWKDAQRGANEWTPCFYAWWEDPTKTKELWPDEARDVERSLTDEEKALIERAHLSVGQIAWRREQQKTLKNLFPQEYPEDAETCFITSGSCFFDKVLITRMLENVPEHEREGYVEFAPPVAGQRYVIGADIAEGLEDGDFSVAGILDAKTEEQMGVLRGHFPPEEFARQCVVLAKRYNEALLAPERNNHGHSFINTVVNQLDYPNLYIYEDYDPSTNQNSPKLGWETNGKSRPVLLDECREHIHKGFMKVRDRVLLEECRTFGPSGIAGKYEAQDGNHDDSIMGWAIALQARKSAQGVAAVGPSSGESVARVQANRRMFSPVAIAQGNLTQTGRIF